MAVKRLWIPLLVFAVAMAGGFAVARLRGIFGSEKRPSYSDSETVDTKPFNPKQISYEIFGPPGTVADVSYVDADADPQYVKGVILPWSFNFTIDKTAAVGSVMAQGNSNDIGCRILVDGQIKAERTSQQVNAFTSCVLKSA